MSQRRINTALISVFDKTGLAEVASELHSAGVKLISTGGTLEFLEKLGLPVLAVEDLTGYPAILGGRVKTLHPKVFGGILARREDATDLSQVGEYDFTLIDLVIVDLYPFEKTVAANSNEAAVIEKIDIGGISLIRAAAKNFNDVCIVSNMHQYPFFLDHLKKQGAKTGIELRKLLAAQAFDTTSHYDTAIYQWFASGLGQASYKMSYTSVTPLRYGENPHQKANFYGDLESLMTQLNGKELSYNNLVDLDAALQLIKEFTDPTIAIIKHTNSCGLATARDLSTAWDRALACDPLSAFGGVIVLNGFLDVETATKINELFFEIIAFPDFDAQAVELLKSKKNRIILHIPELPKPKTQQKSILNGLIVQDADHYMSTVADLRVVTKVEPSGSQMTDLIFAVKAVKHLKSNGIAIVKNQQLIGMGCGQTSRIDALKQAIAKAKVQGFSVAGAVMASDAFFPFPDCVEEASKEGIVAIVQPGGSIKDQDSINAADQSGLSMCLTGHRHFKH